MSETSERAEEPKATSAAASVSEPPRPTTLGELRASGWRSVPVKDEVRRNALARIAAGEPLIEGVMGYDDTVLPQIENAVLNSRPPTIAAPWAGTV